MVTGGTTTAPWGKGGGASSRGRRVYTLVMERAGGSHGTTRVATRGCADKDRDGAPGAAVGSKESALEASGGKLGGGPWQRELRGVAEVCGVLGVRGARGQAHQAKRKVPHVAVRVRRRHRVSQRARRGAKARLEAHQALLNQPD